MTKTRILGCFLIAILFLVPALSAGKNAKRWAGRGAASGAILGFLVGGDLGSAAEGAAVGAATGAVGGAISDSGKKKKAKKGEAEQAMQAQAAQEAEQEALDKAAEMEAVEARARAAATGLPQTEEEWLAAIGQDNMNALDALVDCEYERAALLAQAAGTSEDDEFKLVAYWLEALVKVDQRQTEAAEQDFEVLIDLDDDVDTVQQASLVADQSILEIRQVRTEEGIACTR